MVIVESGMGQSKTLTATREDAWLLNISKHLVNFAPNSIGLSSLENIFFAGECGALLIKSSADETEQLTQLKVRFDKSLYCRAHAIDHPVTRPRFCNATEPFTLLDQA
jgi:hypothetical protein